MRIVPTLVFFLALALGAFAQSVRWERNDAGDPGMVDLVFENCRPDGVPIPPAVPGVQFQAVSSGTRMQFGTGGNFNYFVITFAYRPITPITIPSFTVNTDKGVMTVPAFNPSTPVSADSVARSRLIPERTTVWAGEVFGLTYELSASRRTNAQISPVFDWNAAPLVAEDWSKPELTEAVVSGERRLNVVFRTRAVMNTPNTIKLEAATHVLSVSGPTPFGGFSFFQGPQTQQVSVTSDQPTIEVRPLPTPPAGFTGAVGQFKLTSKVVPEKATVGEPVTWTLDLSGTGNWPNIAGLPSRDVSNDFRVVQPKARRTPVEGKLFDVTLSEDVVLVPTKAGSYALGPINFSYFDPRAGAYKVVSAPRTVITITAPSTPQPVTPPPTAVAPGEPPPPAEEKQFKPPAVPAPPAGIPRDPLVGAAQVRAPMSARALTIGVLSPVSCLLIFWAGLAIRQAHKTDPLRRRREARERLGKTLALLAAAPESERTELLRAWQRDTAVLWQLTHAAPRASALPDGIWQTLWQEADRALYGEKHAVPTDWVARAQEALAAKTVPGFKFWRAFLPQNLMPFAALIAVSFIGVAWLRAADTDAGAAYRKGDFAAAEKSWRARLAIVPTDWIARHNLSLALAQQERTGEAAAEAAAAFVQQPANEAVRWQFALAAEKAGSLAQPLAHFVTPGPLQALARLASPAQWQWTIIVAAWAAALACAGLLLNAFGRGRRGVTLGALVAMALCVGLAGAATAGVHAYGTAAKADAVMVARGGTLRSIPTEADTTQKTSPLSVGALAMADKTFLGWQRLTFDNGQTGWVRKDDIVALWK